MISANKILHVQEIVRPQDELQSIPDQLEISDNEIPLPTSDRIVKEGAKPQKPELLSYRNKFRNEREKKYKK